LPVSRRSYSVRPLWREARPEEPGEGPRVRGLSPFPQEPSNDDGAAGLTGGACRLPNPVYFFPLLNYCLLLGGRKQAARLRSREVGTTL
jgi:hypothetical protein